MVLNEIDDSALVVLSNSLVPHTTPPQNDYPLGWLYGILMVCQGILCIVLLLRGLRHSDVQPPVATTEQPPIATTELTDPTEQPPVATTELTDPTEQPVDNRKDLPPPNTHTVEQELRDEPLALQKAHTSWNRVTQDLVEKRRKEQASQQAMHLLRALRNANDKSPRRGMWNRLLQEITEKQRKERVTEQAMHVMREMRNAKLREHDWRISRESTSGWSDPKIWAEWCMYFNALRDLPQTQTPVIKNGKLSGVEWPVEPPTTDHHNRHVMIILFFVRPRIVQDSNACHQTSVTVKDLFEVYLEFLGHYKDVSPLTFDAYKELMCKTPSRSLCKTSFENMDGGPLVRGLHGRADVIMNFKLDLWGSEILKARKIRLMKHV